MLQQLKKTVPLAIPIIIGHVGQMLMNFIDSVMVGHIGATYLAASAFGNMVFQIPMVFLIGVTVSISVLVSQNYGAGKHKECGKVLWNGFFIVALITAGTLILMLGLTPHLDIFKQPPKVTTLARPFYELLIWSFIPLCIFQSLKQFSDGLGMTKPGSWCLIAGLLVNVILNYLLIYGHFGFPRLELVGAGIGTFLARTISALILLIYILKCPRYKPYLTHFKQSIDFKKAILALKIGLPSGAQYLFEVGAFVGAGILMGWVGTAELAAHQIALNLASITFMFALGMSIASSIRLGQAHGANDIQEAREIGKSSIVFIICVMGFFGLAFIVLKDFLPTLFVTEVGVIHIASQLIVVAALFQMFDGVQSVALGLLRGMSDVRAPTVLTFIAYWAIGLPTAYILAFHFNLRHLGVWVGLALSLLVSSILLSTRFFILVRRSRLSVMLKQHL